MSNHNVIFQEKGSTTNQTPVLEERSPTKPATCESHPSVQPQSIPASRAKPLDPLGANCDVFSANSELRNKENFAFQVLATRFSQMFKASKFQVAMMLFDALEIPNGHLPN